MKLLLATPYFHPRVGGLENYARHLALGLQGRGWEVVVVCGDNVPAMRREQLDGLTIYRLPIWKTVSNTPISPSWPWQLRRIIRTERPDIINVHAPVVFMVDMIALVAGRTPLVITYHAATLFKPDSLLMRAIITAYYLVRQLSFRRANAIIAVSDYVKTALGTRYAAKTHVIPNAVPAAGRRRTRPGQGFVFVANLKPTHAWKGLDATLDAWAVYRQKYGTPPQLTVVGGGSDQARYEAKCQDLGIAGYVTFTGHQNAPERDRTMRAHSALVAYPTTANDAFPTVFLEAWALGLPVVAANIGALTSLINDGQTGLLVEPSQPERLADAIHRLATDPKLTETMGETGRRMVAANFTWPIQVKRTQELLEGLL